MVDKNKSKYIFIGIIIVLAVLLIYSYSKSSISVGSGDLSEQPKYCLNDWQASKAYVRDEQFTVKLNLADLDRRTEQDKSANVYSLPFGYHDSFYFACEKERPAADICFIDSVLVQSNTYGDDGVATDSLWYPEFETNQERYIKSFTIGCVCYYDDELNIKRKFSEDGMSINIQ